MKTEKRFNYVGVLLIILIICCYFVRIIKSPISIDTEAFIANPKGIIHSWDSISRVSLGVIKGIFNNYHINLFVTNFVSFIILYISVSILCVDILKRLKKYNFYNYCIFVIGILSSVFMAECYGFTLQILEISICYLFMIISFILLDKVISHNIYWYLMVVIPVIGICFGAYQSFILLYITLSCIYYLIGYDDKMVLKRRILELLKYIVILILGLLFSFLFNQWILALKGVSANNGYLMEQINYLYDFKKGIIYLGATVLYSTCGRYFINLAYPVLICFLVKKLVKHYREHRDLLYVIAFFGLMISPFLLSVVLGNFTFFRSQFSLPIVISFLFVYFDFGKIQKKVIAAHLFYQILCIFILFYCDNVRYNKDYQLLEDVVSNYHDNSKSIVFIGNTNYLLLRGEMLGNSIFNWDYDSDALSNNRIYDFSIATDLKYKRPTQEEIDYVKANQNSYHNFYQVDRDIIVINVGKK